MSPMQKRPVGSVMEVIEHLRLAWRLFRDGRVPAWTKAIPVLTLAYLIWPIDLLADPILGLGQLDDLAILVLGLQLFMSLCSPALVEQIRGEGRAPRGEGQVIDSTFRVVNDSSSVPPRRP